MNRTEILITLGGMTFILFVIGYLYWSLYYIAAQFENKRHRDKFFKALLRGLETGTVKTLEDVFNIYSAIIGRSYELDESNYIIGNRLKSFLLLLLTKSANELNNCTVEQIKSWKDIISRWLEELKKEMPYSGIPEAERTVLQEIDRLLDSKEIEGVKGRIKELSGKIQIRSEEYEKIQKKKRWADRFSIAGFFITAVSLVYAICITLKPVKIDETQLNKFFDSQQAKLTQVPDKDVKQ